MTAGVSQHHTGVPELKKAYQEAVYAINQRLIDGWVKVYSYKRRDASIQSFHERSGSASWGCH